MFNGLSIDPAMVVQDLIGSSEEKAVFEKVVQTKGGLLIEEN